MSNYIDLPEPKPEWTRIDFECAFYAVRERLIATLERAENSEFLCGEVSARCADAEAALAAAREENERLKRSMDNRREMRWMDMTPDAGLASRILSAYIDNTSCTDNLTGLDPESFVCKMMNEHTAQRNVLLKSALAALRDDPGRVERAEILNGYLAAELAREYGTDAESVLENAKRRLAAADNVEGNEMARCTALCLVVGWARPHFCPECPANTSRPWLKESCEVDAAFVDERDDDPNASVCDPGFEWHHWPGINFAELREAKQ